MLIEIASFDVKVAIAISNHTSVLDNIFIKMALGPITKW